MKDLVGDALRKLEGVDFTIDPVFGLAVPASVPDVPTAVLQPRGTWADPVAYDEAAMRYYDLTELERLARVAKTLATNGHAFA